MKTNIKYAAMLLLLIAFSCDTKRESGKDQAEEQNDEKFDNRKEEKGDAQFVVDQMENSYEMLQLAKLAEEKSTKAEVKLQAKKIIEVQNSVIEKLESYAKSNDISITTSPEDIAPGVKRLNDEEVDDFDNKWGNQMSKENKEMIDDFDDYEDKADGSLQEVVASSLTMLRQNQDGLEKYNSENKDDNN
jgi:putative membrane protein